jgi:glycosyltransferase involved in cell wall biosynthesis
MRVAMEAASLGLSSGGLARYTSELSLALARCFPQDEFVLVSDQPFPMPPGAPANLKRGGGPRTAAERRWWLWGLGREARRWQANLVHGPDFAVPYLPQLPSVLTLHDLSPWMDSGWHHAAQRVRQRCRVLLNLGIPTMIVTPSETVRKQALARFRIREERIVTVPEAPASWLQPVNMVQPVKTSPARPYFLFVGTLEPRKNLPTLVEAWREVRRDYQIDLVLAGRRRPDGPRFSEEPGLRLPGEVPDQHLPQLYSGARAFVYPSLYEGFGLPVVEAMQCGTCVITSSACRQAGGDAAIYVDTPAELVQAMRRAASDTQWVAEHQAKSLAHASEFSWERSARLTYEVYEEARRRFGR